MTPQALSSEGNRSHHSDVEGDEDGRQDSELQYKKALYLPAFPGKFEAWYLNFFDRSCLLLFSVGVAILGPIVTTNLVWIRVIIEFSSILKSSTLCLTGGVVLVCVWLFIFTATEEKHDSRGNSDSQENDRFPLKWIHWWVYLIQN